MNNVPFELKLFGAGLDNSTVALCCLVCLALWAITLVLFIVVVRTAGLMSNKSRLTDFPGGQKHGGVLEIEQSTCKFV